MPPLQAELARLRLAMGRSEVVRPAELQGPKKPPPPGILGPSTPFPSALRSKGTFDRTVPGTVGRQQQPVLPKGDLLGLYARLDALEGVGIQQAVAGIVDDHPIRWVRLHALEGAPRLRVLITAGIHGKEAAAPAAALQLLESLTNDPAWRKDVEWTVLPVICPHGFLEGTRRNKRGINLNRKVFDRPGAPAEIKAARKVLDDGHYDLAIDLHASKSAGDRGFFAIHNGGEDLLHEAVTAFTTRYGVLDRSTELYERTGPGVFRSRNEGTVKDYLRRRGTVHSYTVEAPALAPHELQVRGLVDFIRCLTGAAHPSLDA